MTKRSYRLLNLQPSMEDVLGDPGKKHSVLSPITVALPPWMVGHLPAEGGGLGVTGGVGGRCCIFKGNTASEAFLLPSHSHLIEVKIVSVWSDHT